MVHTKILFWNFDNDSYAQNSEIVLAIRFSVPRSCVCKVYELILDLHTIKKNNNLIFTFFDDLIDESHLTIFIILIGQKMSTLFWIK